MAVAVHITTESGDDYLYVFDGEPSHEEVNAKIKEQLGDEFNYVCRHLYESTFEPKTPFVLDEADIEEEEFNEDGDEEEDSEEEVWQ